MLDRQTLRFGGGFGAMPDQADGLRRLLGCAPLHAIAFAGDGATTLVANLGAALGARGQDVLLIDENANHGNLADQLGVATRFELLHALHGERPLHEVMRPAGCGVRLLPAARGARELAARSDDERFVASLRQAPPAPDLILIDSASGRLSRLLRRSEANCQTVIVAGSSHDAITSAYALIKTASREIGETRFGVIVNRARDAQEANAIFRNMALVAHKHAGAALELLGWLPQDAQLRHARTARRCAVDLFPAGGTAIAVRALAERLRDRFGAGAASEMPARMPSAGAIFNLPSRSAAANL